VHSRAQGNNHGSLEVAQRPVSGRADGTKPYRRQPARPTTFSSVTSGACRHPLSFRGLPHASTGLMMPSAVGQGSSGFEDVRGARRGQDCSSTGALHVDLRLRLRRWPTVKEPRDARN
jgi:hypothetical protein